MSNHEKSLIELLNEEVAKAKEEMIYEATMDFNEYMYGHPLGPWRQVKLMGLQEIIDEYGKGAGK